MLLKRCFSPPVRHSLLECDSLEALRKPEKGINLGGKGDIEVSTYRGDTQNLSSRSMVSDGDTPVKGSFELCRGRRVTNYGSFSTFHLPFSTAPSLYLDTSTPTYLDTASPEPEPEPIPEPEPVPVIPDLTKSGSGIQSHLNDTRSPEQNFAKREM